MLEEITETIKARLERLGISKPTVLLTSSNYVKSTDTDTLVISYKYWDVLRVEDLEEYDCTEFIPKFIKKHRRYFIGFLPIENPDLVKWKIDSAIKEIGYAWKAIEPYHIRGMMFLRLANCTLRTTPRSVLLVPRDKF